MLALLVQALILAALKCNFGNGGLSSFVPKPDQEIEVSWIVGKTKQRSKDARVIGERYVDLSNNADCNGLDTFRFW